MQRISVFFIACVLCGSHVYADELRTHTVKLAAGGHFQFEVPETWGSKPEVDSGDMLTQVRFVPAGTPRAPIFAITLVAGLTEDPIDASGVRKVAERIRDEFKETALEDEIAIYDRAETANMISYFTLTDKEKKPREYQYLTAAIVSDGNLVVTCYFFSNDGAPDYAADAMHLMDTMRFVAKAEKKKRR